MHWDSLTFILIAKLKKEKSNFTPLIFKGPVVQRIE